MHLVSKCKAEKNIGVEPTLFSNVRNEMLRLPFFLDWYRSRGISHFVIVDNNSTDESVEFLKAQTDVTLYSTNDSFVKALCGLTWLDELRDKYGKDQWCLTVDCDELLRFPFDDLINIPELCRYLNTNAYEGLFSLLVDHYSDQIKPHKLIAGDSFYDHSPYFDHSGYITRDSSAFPFIGVSGGPRYRLMYAPKQKFGPSMRKIPLVKWVSGVEYLAVNHSTTNIKIADITSVLQHFKFLDDFKSHVNSEVERNDRLMVDYEVYKNHLSTNDKASFYHPSISTRFVDTNQLQSLGLMKSSGKFSKWLKHQKNNAKESWPDLVRLEHDNPIKNAVLENWASISYLSSGLSDIERVSVIVPFYNAERCLERCVKSVLPQRCLGELILVDDGSIDKSSEIAARLALRHRKIKLLQHPGKLNRGAGNSRNLGVFASQFEYIAFLDCDDSFTADRFLEDVRVLDQNENASGVFGSQALSFENEGTKQERIEKGLSLRIEMPIGIQGKTLFGKMNPVGNAGSFHMNALTLRKSEFLRIDGFDPLVPRCEDVNFYMKLAFSCNLIQKQDRKAYAIKLVHSGNRMSPENTRLHRPNVFSQFLKFAINQPLDHSKVRKSIDRYLQILDNNSPIKDKAERDRRLKRIYWALVFNLGGSALRLRKALLNLFRRRFERPKLTTLAAFTCLALLGLVLHPVRSFHQLREPMKQD